MTAESNFIMQPAPRPSRHGSVFTAPDTLLAFEKLECQLRLMGYSFDQAKQAVDDFVLSCQSSLQHPLEKIEDFARKMSELALASGKITKAEKRKLEVERADKVLKEPLTLDDVTVYVPVADPGLFSQKAVRLTRDNRHALLARRLKQKGKK